ncbi:MAG: hypothetical protein A2509_06360 [Candidatus Edwardsbacteria bacterium RIFOXYD12_FULL_50_11]|uniref:Gingipain domain-containing protein n=1 Tax=Candidatus Edwardsbacteria bacterium GWF2_54_11 TaxID=1817851 RepID=A0A1F5R315_9BACT|nr:MAG: hypothetical protein A2502_10255 [Candidatus Edwardsbacteria bacterium RifOxyC12_full_54_24]OGF06780.1 MAG: hypothetical protein A2273_00805 [Candidatus Edwardsbacteria bacterium RifOxyA12_full_54_48]OGF08847.1 MAG: hypothetical protein A2024_01065 [Candidatus Edwardsbacteria bacterium GWF2_54_11]OGF10730.1 MAG: hypothetical protein A3K15_06170 [Candidatus Edwardsbacteria bacterium GWE2_54_12]OGF15511.1 MAG: hypothetical protein A2509_06360 [Candidatus Edwardsbacteria bacterium RIFOXYD1
MKKYAAVIAGLLYFSAAALAGIDIIKSDESGMILEFGADTIKTSPRLVGNRIYHQISVDGCANTIDCGKPSLPQYSIMLAVPYNALAIITRIEMLDKEYIPVVPLPSPAPAEMDNGFVIDQTIYSGRAQYPAQGAILSNPGWAGNTKVSTATVFPVVFDPANSRVIFSRRIRVTIEYKITGAYPQGVQPTQSRLNKVLLGAVANPKQAEKWGYRALSKAGQLSCDTMPYKMFIKSDGIYKVGYNELLAAGINPDLTDPRCLKITHKGREVALYFKGQADGVFDADDYFEFYGQASRGDSTYYHQFSNANVYYLSLTGSLGARMAEEEGTPVLSGMTPASHFSETLHFEKDSLFYRLSSLNSDQHDRWFWKRLDYPASAVIGLDIPSPHISSGDSFILKGSLHGITTDWHHVQLLLNGYLIADLAWYEQTEKEFSVKFPAAAVINGANSLTVKHDTTSNTSNKILINWFEIDYKRGFAAPGGDLTFATDTNISDSLVQYTLTGLPAYTTEVYKLGISKIVGSAMTLGASGLDYDLSFQDRIYGDERYLVIRSDNKRKLSPGDLAPNKASNLRDPAFIGTEYVVITSDELTASAGKMVQIRGANYPNAIYALTTDIYDEFNDGIPSDRAIRDYLKYAFDNWSIQPEYVLLMGDGSYDPRNVMGNSKRDQIPVHLTRTDYYGGIADDDYFVRVKGDDFLPDISIGRLPVNSNQEFTIWENKRQLYDQRLFLDRWHKDILFVAGWPLNIEDNFYSPSDKLAAMVSPAYDIAKVYHGSAYQNKEDLINRLNQGVAVAVFFGHGGAQLWSHGSFFWYYDVPRLDNWGRWPLIGSFTCSSGAFESPLYTSISESFIFNSGGAIGIYTSSGASYGDSITGCVMENTFMDAWDRRGFRYFGDIALSSKYNLAGGLPPSGQTLDMLASYNLLGDPAVRLALPDTGLRVEISQTAVFPGDSTQVKITGPFGPGLAVISLYDSGRRIILQNAFSSSAGQAQTYLTIPDSALSGQAYLKIYLKDDNSDWVAVEYLGISRPAVSGIKIIPSAPTDIDSIQITGIVQSLYGIDSVWCRWHWGSYNDTTDTGNVFNQSLMTLSGDSARLNSKLYLAGLEGNYPSQSEIYLVFRVSAQDTLGNITTGRWENHKILRRADLTPSSQAQGSVYLGGKRVLTINAPIKNQGDIDADSIPVSFHRSGDDSLLGLGLIDAITAGKEKTLSLPWTIEGEFTQLYYRIDPLLTLVLPYPQEDTTNDNSAAYWVPSQDFYYYQLDARGNNQDTLDYYSKIKAFFPDSCLHDSAVAIIGRKLFDINGIAQSGLIPFDSLGQAYFVGLTDSSRAFENNRALWVSLKLDNIDSTTDLNNLKLLRNDDITGLWQLIPSQIDGSYISGFSPQPGTFAAMYSTDTTGPQITAKVDQQAVGWGQIISVPDPQYSVMIEDRDGINADSIWLKLDNQIVNRSDYSLAIDPDKSHSVQLVYSAKLKNGRHSLEAGAADNLGNKSSLKIFNDVKIEFSLKEIANYPNPVNGDITTFYFYVGDVADKYELKIYTVAGRLIKTFKGGLTSGVRTFGWDLRDESGRGVANGVYFYKVTVSQGGKVKERTGKMAVLR